MSQLISPHLTLAKRCDTCHGNGYWVNRLDLFFKSKNPVTIFCWRCHGTGKLTGEKIAVPHLRKRSHGR